jgi:hypothetical protein
MTQINVLGIDIAKQIFHAGRRPSVVSELTP